MAIGLAEAESDPGLRVVRRNLLDKNDSMG